MEIANESEKKKQKRLHNMSDKDCQEDDEKVIQKNLEGAEYERGGEK